MRPYSNGEEGESSLRVGREGSHLVVYYLGENPEDVIIKEETELDFRELRSRLASGGSVFVTMKPNVLNDEVCEWC